MKKINKMKEHRLKKPKKKKGIKNFVKFTKGILWQMPVDEGVNTSRFPKKKDKVTLKKKKKGPTVKKNDINNTVRKGTKVTTSKARIGKANGRWKGGRSKSYRRDVSNPDSGQVVHHKDKTKTNNKRSNFKNVSPAQHNKEHPEKGGHNKKKRRKK